MAEGLGPARGPIKTNTRRFVRPYRTRHCFLHAHPGVCVIKTLVWWCAVVHTGSPPLLTPAMTKRIRLTISLLPEAHAVFSRMAQVSGTSLGKCIGDWLADTAEGAQFVASKMEQARSAPKTVMREFQAMARGLVEEVDASIDEIRKKSMAASRATKAQLRGADRGHAGPPSSNTGGKVPRKNPNKPVSERL